MSLQAEAKRDPRDSRSPQSDDLSPTYIINYSLKIAACEYAPALCTTIKSRRRRNVTTTRRQSFQTRLPG